jgi:hypothetical protein
MRKKSSSRFPTSSTGKRDGESPSSTAVDMGIMRYSSNIGCSESETGPQRTETIIGVPRESHIGMGSELNRTFHSELAGLRI